MADATIVTRDERGNWRPDYLKQLPAPWLWPPRPLGILRWFFGWPGYLWPGTRSIWGSRCWCGTS